MLKKLVHTFTLTAILVGIPTLAFAAASAADEECCCPLCCLGK